MLFMTSHPTNKSILYTCVISLLPIVLTITAAYPAHQHDNIYNMATGSTTGVYYPIGKAIREAAKKANIQINVLNSEGSIENLNWLEQGKAQLCIAQADILYYAFNGLGRFPQKLSNIRVISSLYTEAVHIIIRNPLYIKKIEDMKGKRISMGPLGSGTEPNARSILEASGLTQNEFKLLNLTFDESINAIKENNVDIAFLTAGIPADAVSKILKDNTAYLFEMNSDLLRRLIEAYPFFVITTIPPRTYPNQDEDIATIGVPAMLVGRGDLSDNLVFNLTNSIFSNSKLISQYHQMAANIKLESALRGVSIPISNGAILFYRDKGLYRAETYRKVINYLFIALFIFALAIAILKFKQIKFFFQTKEVIRILIVLFLIWFLGSYILYFAEHRLNENYANIFLSLWSGLVNLINFGSKEPFTTTGRTVSVVMMALGVGGIAWLTGEMASIFVHRKLTGGKRKMEKMKNHYVIANWNSKGYGIIEQLHSSDLEEKRPIIILSEVTDGITLPDKEVYESVYTIKGNPTNEIFLRRAHVQRAHSIIILAREMEPSVADAQSILIILAIRKICLESKVGQLPMVVEIMDPQKVDLAGFAGVEGGGSIEIISSQHLGERLITQAAASPGVSRVYYDLLTYDSEGGEIYKYRVPSKFIGQPFDAILKYSLDLRQKGINIIPIAIYRRDKLFINPKIQDINVMEEGDYLFAICSREGDLKNLE